MEERRLSPTHRRWRGGGSCWTNCSNASLTSEHKSHASHMTSIYGSHMMSIHGSYIILFGSHMMTIYGSHMIIYGSHMTSIFGSHLPAVHT